MKYFNDPSMGVRAFEEDGSQDFLITPNMIPMSQEDFDRYQADVNRSVPVSVSRRQAKQAMLARGILDEVEEIVSKSPRSMQIDWEDAYRFDRSWPVIDELLSGLGMSSKDIDEMFIEASSL